MTTVLVIDDDPSVLRFLVDSLEFVRYEVYAALDGKQGVQLAQQHLPQAIVCDIMMPQMDGYEFTSTLRAQAAYQHLPVVMLTSRSGEKHRQKAFEVGATEYLVKPYQDDVLLSTIRRLVPQAEGVSAA